jgi:hypothetical protein
VRVGTLSLLVGVHQVLWHPLTCILAWRRLFGYWPTWRELVCIFIHDWGYAHAPNMDGVEGERHPELGARLAGRLFGPGYCALVLYHSRHYARQFDEPCSRLCWADKLSIWFDPPWFYLLRARLSGELAEYRALADRAGFVPREAPDRVWLRGIRWRFARLALARRGDAVPYLNHSGGR